MTNNPFTTGLLQWTHAVTLPWRLFGRPSDAGFLEAVRQRNILLDALFYDVEKVRHDEAVRLAPWKAGEGAMLIVPPSDGPELTVCPDLDAFFAAGGAAIDAIAVAGVGSSALGTAAFARNVADAIGRPVVAVVSGYGLADLVTEASGGFAWAAGLDGLHRLWERIDHSLDWIRTLEANALGETASRLHRDTDTLAALLRDPRLQIGLLVGHSKGNLVIADALHELQRTDRARSDDLCGRIRIVCFSARPKLPRACAHVTEVIGRYDLIGGFATRREAPPAIVVPDAWHHTNTALVGHLPVTKILKEILGEAEASATSAPAAAPAAVEIAPPSVPEPPPPTVEATPSATTEPSRRAPRRRKPSSPAS